jgi:Na+/proline symporter
MDMSHKAEKWAGRVLLGCGVGFMVLISWFATSLIADPSKAHDPLLIGGFIAGFMVLGAPVGLLVTVLPILRRINRYKDKRQEDRQFSWMTRK